MQDLTPVCLLKVTEVVVVHTLEGRRDPCLCEA